MNTQTIYLASKPHYEILDGLRGVAAVMVVAFHLLEAHSGGATISHKSLITAILPLTSSLCFRAL